jgi:CRP-like cAMP-binding protein
MRPQDQYLEKLKTIHLFASIKDDEQKLRQLLLICDSTNFKKGETIIKEGDNGSEMFILYSGAVDILKRTREGDNYTVVKLSADIPAGVVFGDLAMVDDDRRSATVLAAEDSEFLVIKKMPFSNWVIWIPLWACQSPGPLLNGSLGSCGKPPLIC